MSKILFITLTLFISHQAAAGLLIDPYIGYGAISTDSDVPDDDAETQTGSFIGTRIGYSFVLLSAGLDVSAGSAGNLDRTNTAVFAGVDLPILFRFWGKYLLSSDLDNNDNDFDDFSYDLKNGYVLGAGFTGLPFVSLNAEYGKTFYEASSGGDDYDFDTESFMLSVSLPLDF